MPFSFFSRPLLFACAIILSVLSATLARAEETAEEKFVPPAEAPKAPESVHLRLAAPLDFQVYQRQTYEKGRIRIEGEWSQGKRASANGVVLEASVDGPDAPAFSESWQPLPFNGEARGFRGEVEAKAGGWYRVTVRLRRDELVLASVTVEHVGVGEVFLIAGQSNSANYGEERQQPKTGKVSAFDGEAWRLAADPQPGATGTKGSFIPSFGDRLVEQLGVPIGVVCIGVGSTSVREWLPANTPIDAPPTTGAHVVAVSDGRLVSSGELFQRLCSRLERFPEGIRAVLWHQGESDWNQADHHKISAEAYARALKMVIDESRKSVGREVPWFVARASYHSPTDRGSQEFRAAQLSVTDQRSTFPGPNTDELGPEFREHQGQGVHFNAVGQRRHGEAWAEVVAAWLTEKNPHAEIPAGKKSPENPPPHF